MPTRPSPSCRATTPRKRSAEAHASCKGKARTRAALSRTHAALETGEAFQGEALNSRKDGTPYQVEWLITPVRDADGRIINWVSAQRDVTQRRAFEDRQALIVRELHHRVKNTLATVQAVLNATMRSSVTMVEFSEAFGGRIGFESDGLRVRVHLTLERQ